MPSIGYAITWSISTEIGMYVMFVLAMVICRHFSPLAFLAAGAAYLAPASAAIVFRAEIDQALILLPAVDERLAPGDGWRWFYYVSPYFRFAQFLLGAGAAMLAVSGKDIKLQPFLSRAAALAR